MKRERNFSQITNEALECLRRGQNILAILEQFPKEAERLAPILKTAQAVIRVSQPQAPTGVEATSKARMMHGLNEKKTSFSQHKEEIMDDLGAGFQRERGRRLILAILGLVIVFILLSTLSVSALAALPGSALYPAKLALQDLRILLTFNPVLRQARITYFYQLRMLELEKAVEFELLTEMEAQATVTAMPTPEALPISPFLPIKP